MKEIIWICRIVSSCLYIQHLLIGDLERKDSMTKLLEYNIGEISLVGENTFELPMWSINYYLQELCNNYSKLLIIQRICELSQQGACDKCFFVGKQSASLFPRGAISKSLSENSTKYIILSEKDPKEFWDAILSHSRPIVFYKHGTEILPLYDYKNKEAIKINKLTFNSPVNIDIQGAVNGLLDLIEAPKKHQIKEEEFEARQIGQLACNYSDIARAAQTINDPRTPEGIRHYANQGLYQLLEKQRKLNDKLEIRITRIDVIR
jgi:hypothetical protein